MSKELSPKYNPAEVEAGRYQKWLDEDVFKPSGDQKAKPYSIVIPPPNVTGKLHLGHAWDTTLQDIIIRQKRMQGFDTLWLPGMDHAGIATQAKVEERLRGEGISRYDLGREKFLEKVWEWKDEYATTIKEQWGKMGLSVDYSRERFTLDEGLSKAVRKVFVELYKKGWIYRGEFIINWDPKARTALSDIEVIHKDVEGAFYHMNYMLEDGSRALEVATTRPETMFGDTAVAVNPNDDRYKDLIGKNVKGKLLVFLFCFAFPYLINWIIGIVYTTFLKNFSIAIIALLGMYIYEFYYLQLVSNKVEENYVKAIEKFLKKSLKIDNKANTLNNDIIRLESKVYSYENRKVDLELLEKKRRKLRKKLIRKGQPNIFRHPIRFYLFLKKKKRISKLVLRMLN